MAYVDDYFSEAVSIINLIDKAEVTRMIEAIAQIREARGRLFFLGVGGSAGNCSHAVNDFRKIAGIEAYAPVDNVSELTARTNDEGWHTVFSEWLKTSNLGEKDGVFVFSVGGGDREKNISANWHFAILLRSQNNRGSLAPINNTSIMTWRWELLCIQKR